MQMFGHTKKIERIAGRTDSAQSCTQPEQEAPVALPLAWVS